MRKVGGGFFTYRLLKLLPRVAVPKRSGETRRQLELVAGELPVRFHWCRWFGSEARGTRSKGARRDSAPTGQRSCRHLGRPCRSLENDKDNNLNNCRNSLLQKLQKRRSGRLRTPHPPFPNDNWPAYHRFAFRSAAISCSDSLPGKHGSFARVVNEL